MEDFIWLEIVKNCSTTLQSLKLCCHSSPLNWPPTTPALFPRLKSLSIIDWLPRKIPLVWPPLLITSALISYECTEDRSDPYVVHRDAQSVTCLRSSSPFELSRYVNLQTYWAIPNYHSGTIYFAHRLAAQLQDISTCPALQLVALHREEKDELSKRKALEMLKKARPNIEVIFTTKFERMPGSMREIEVSTILRPTVVNIPHVVYAPHAMLRHLEAI